MNPVAFRGTRIVPVHMIILFGHGAAHSHLQIEPSPWQHSFITIVIVAAPVLVAFLLWTRWQKAGWDPSWTVSGVVFDRQAWSNREAIWN